MIKIAASEVKIELDLQAALGECPLWSAATQTLYFVDISKQRVQRYTPATRALDRWDAPEAPGCIALMHDGKDENLMVALRSGFRTLNINTGVWGELIPVDHDTTQFRFNDGRVDSHGRFWAGTMFEPRTSSDGALFCLEKGQVRRVLGPENGCGVKVSNGLAFSYSADGSAQIYHSDTPNHIVKRYAFDAQTGAVDIASASTYAQMQDTRPAPTYGGRPDGAAVDSAGHYWSAQYEGARILRFAPDGTQSGEIQLPVKRPTMIAFGGADLQTLYITSAGENASADELAKYPHTGALLSVRLPVRGCTEPVYLVK